MSNSDQSIPNSNVQLPDFKEFVDRRIEEALTFTNCIGLGTIQSFNTTNQTATISLNFVRLIKKGISVPSPLDNTAIDQKIPFPILVSCPVVVLNGGGAFLSFPIAKGDTCVLLFCDRDIDTWYTTGSVDVPNSDRIHDLNDAIALVGIRSLNNSIAGYDPAKVVLSFLTGQISIPDIHGERLCQTGDVKQSLRTANHSGWLIMNGTTIGKAGSGATNTGELYRDLFNIVKLASPNTGSEDFDSGNTVVIPDMRGRAGVGADNMGGSQANVLTSANTPNRNVLGGTIGEEKHQLTVAEMPSHSHTHNGICELPPSLSLKSGTSSGNNTVGTTNSVGGDGSHNTVQPGTILYYFIKI